MFLTLFKYMLLALKYIVNKILQNMLQYEWNINKGLYWNGIFKEAWVMVINN